MNVEKEIKNSKPLDLTKRSVIHILLVYHRITDHFAQVLKPFGISLQQFNVLRILRGLKGAPANLSTLNERMVSPMSNTTRLVDKLVVKGYVTREVCPSNRRKVEIGITESGLQALQRIDPLVEQTERKLMGKMNSKELTELNRLLHLIQ